MSDRPPDSSTDIESGSESEIAARVRAFITENFYVAGGAPLASDASLLDHGIVDSTGVLEVITFLEKSFAITIEDDEMIPDNLDSIAAIVRFTAAKQSAKQ